MEDTKIRNAEDRDFSLDSILAEFADNESKEKAQSSSPVPPETKEGFEETRRFDGDAETPTIYAVEDFESTKHFEPASQAEMAEVFDQTSIFDVIIEPEKQEDFEKTGVFEAIKEPVKRDDFEKTGVFEAIKEPVKQESFENTNVFKAVKEPEPEPFDLAAVVDGFMSAAAEQEKMAEENPGYVPEEKAVTGDFIFHNDLEPELQAFTDSDAVEADYASAGIEYESAAADANLDAKIIAPDGSKAEEKPKKNFKEMVSNPIIAFLALISMRIKQSQLSFHALAEEESDDLGEEMSPAQAAKFYDKPIFGLKHRARISLIVSLVLIYINCGLPVLGALKSPTVCSAVSLILLLTVMLLGLDIIRDGFLEIIRLKPGINSLVALSCLFSALDAFIIALGAKVEGLPYCAVAALCLCFATYGNLLSCRDRRLCFKLAGSRRRLFTLTAEPDLADDGEITLLKSRRGVQDFVRRTEESGPDEVVYGFAAPFFIIVCIVLALLGSLIGPGIASYFHVLSGMFIWAAPVSILIIYPMHSFVSTKILAHRGAAIAGWSGLLDLGKSKHIIICDRDLFAKNNVTIEKTRILAGMNAKKVISMAGSIISAAGSSLTPAFSDLMLKGGGEMKTVDQFSCHESGGLMAMIDGEEVLCGSSGFMQLMGVRLPQRLSLKNCVFLAVSGTLNAIFEIRYTADDDVRDSLVSLMQSNRHPIFALRDFNLTPTMLSKNFDVPTDGFDFPPYPSRYELSAAEPGENSKPCAIISHSGLTPFVKLADHGKRLYTIVRVALMLSMLTSIIGVLSVFIVSLGGTLVGATAAKALLYMFLLMIIQLALIFILKPE